MTGFQSLYYAGICDQDGRNWKCTHPVDFISRDGARYQIPIGAPTDGASIPALLWSKLPPFGPYWLAAVLHDAAYQNTLLRYPVGSLVASKAFTSPDDRPKCDLLLKEAMEASGVDSVTAALIYEAVSLFGASSFKSDRTF